jgi:hypothetical protein
MNEQIYNNYLNYLQTNVIPPSITYFSTKTQYKFKNKANKFNIKNNKLYFKNKPVIIQSQLNEFLTEKWSNPSTGFMGMNKFYQYLSSISYGITELQINNWLKNQEVWQLHQPVTKKITVKPIIANKPHERYQIDLIDMSKYKYWNNGFSWIMTIIDMFSKYTWAIPLKNKSADTVVEAMRLFLQNNITPHIIQSDNGSEWISNHFKNLMNEYDIKQIFSQPYKPQSQGSIERFNGTLKRKLFKFMTLYRTKIWVDSLDEFIKNYNTSIHSTINLKPIKAQYASEKQQSKIKQQIINKSVKTIASNKNFLPLHLGDSVRISNLTKKSVRKLQGRKEYFQNWSKSIYKIHKIIVNKHAEEQYQLQNKNNFIKLKLYFRHELQHINPNTLQTINKERPVYNEDFFDREQHLEQIHQPHIEEDENDGVILITPPPSPTLAQSKPVRQKKVPTKFVSKEPVKPHEDETYEVEKILDDSVDEKTGKKIYLIKWKHYADSESTWEFVNEIKHLQIYKNYLKNKNNMK